MSEKDISKQITKLYEYRAKKVLDKLQKSYFDAHFASTCDEALSYVIHLIPKTASVGIGDSMTLHQIGFFEWLDKQKDKQVFNPTLKNEEGYSVYTSDQRFELQRKALTVDVFVTSVNAVTLEGELISVDGGGNRVAATIFGPGRVILVIGANKIVRNREEAFARIRETCAPLNAMRHVDKHHSQTLKDLPCVQTGLCIDCQNPARICRKTVIISGQSPAFFAKKQKGISVVLVGKSLGI
jgi:L-lactate utilization protein LutB